MWSRFAGSLLAVQLFLCGFVEAKRWQDIRKPGSQGEPGSFLGFEASLKGTSELGYPGGPFDPLGEADNAIRVRGWDIPVGACRGMPL